VLEGEKVVMVSSTGCDVPERFAAALGQASWVLEHLGHNGWSENVHPCLMSPRAASLLELGLLMPVRELETVFWRLQCLHSS
jgi:hypothetical protein